MAHSASVGAAYQPWATAVRPRYKRISAQGAEFVGRLCYLFLRSQRGSRPSLSVPPFAFFGQLSFLLRHDRANQSACVDLCATRSLCLVLTGLYRRRMPAALIRKADVIVSERIGSRCGALETNSSGLRHTHVFQLALWCSLAWSAAAGDTLGCLTGAA